MMQENESLEEIPVHDLNEDEEEEKESIPIKINKMEVEEDAKQLSWKEGKKKIRI